MSPTPIVISGVKCKHKNQVSKQPSHSVRVHKKDLLYSKLAFERGRLQQLEDQVDMLSVEDPDFEDKYNYLIEFFYR